VMLTAKVINTVLIALCIVIFGWSKLDFSIKRNGDLCSGNL
jgi:hypothetical protein